MSTNKTIIGISIALIILAGFIVLLFDEKQEEVARHYAADITIEETWQLPGILQEVSGIAFISDNRLACIQDEDGKIFIYDLSSSEIEKEIDFSGGGDYEGITLRENTAFVLRSDGSIFKVTDFLTDHKVTEHSTPLTGKQDVEGLAYDAENDRLLLAIKEEEPETNNFKGVYAVDPETMEMQKEPVFKLLFRDPVFEGMDAEKSHETFKPSEINVNPTTGDIYLLEADRPKLLILEPNGKPKRLRFLDNRNFPQPEGITFDESGTTYISNEGNPATIHQISLK